MIRLTNDDSVPRVKDATERHMRLCTQNRNGEKYKALILPFYSDYDQKVKQLDELQKEVNFAQDSIWLHIDSLGNSVRDLNGRAKEFDRNNTGSTTSTLLFPGGNFTSFISLSDKEKPDAASNIVLKVLSLGKSHDLYSITTKIESAIANSRTALAQHVTATQNLGNDKTALEISKVAVVKQYNASYFVAASDYDKAFAETLYPRLRPGKKKNGDGENGNGETKP